MKKKLQKLTALFLGIVMLPVIPVSVDAEEPVVKDFEYFYSLSDYEVYCEIYDAFYGVYFGTGEGGPKETLPPVNELPFVYHMNEFINDRYLPLRFTTNAEFYDKYYDTPDLIVDDEGRERHYQENKEMFYNPEVMGFPSSWRSFSDEERTVDSAVYIERHGTTDLHGGKHLEVVLDCDKLAEYDSRFADKRLSSDVFDVYRLMLTLWYSDLFENYLLDRKAPRYWFPVPLGVPLDTTLTFVLYGDHNKDGVVNAADSSVILQYAALVGTGYTGTMEEYVESLSTE